jgi:hypothetical protein
VCGVLYMVEQRLVFSSVNSIEKFMLALTERVARNRVLADTSM